MSNVRLHYGSSLDEAVAKWADTLTTNNDDYVYVDGEEGDFGVVRFFGTDIDGNENVHMATQYIHGGDIEHDFYTLAGADMVQKIMRENFETALRHSLEESLDPGRSGNLVVGFVKDFEAAQEKVKELGGKVESELHQRWAELFPDYIEDRMIFKYGFKFFQAYVIQLEQAPAQIRFVNVVNPCEFLAIKLLGKLEGQVGLMISQDGWRHSFKESRICVVQVAEDLPQYATAVRFDLAAVKVVG